MGGTSLKREESANNSSQRQVSSRSNTTKHDVEADHALAGRASADMNAQTVLEAQTVEDDEDEEEEDDHFYAGDADNRDDLESVATAQAFMDCANSSSKYYVLDPRGCSSRLGSASFDSNSSSFPFPRPNKANGPFGAGAGGENEEIFDADHLNLDILCRRSSRRLSGDQKSACSYRYWCSPRRRG
ncbi:unnamed protein product [Amoebophrya sp. A25]|nr:unnamed protein product [Amoebophrya sp. A25]|eukprot:GSA25T00010199001.1